MSVDHAARRARLAAMLPAHGAEAILITRAVNVRYLTGLASSNAAVLVRADGSAALATDARYIETARPITAADPAGIELVEERDVAGRLAELAGAVRLAVESHHMPIDEYARLGGAVGAGGAHGTGVAGGAGGTTGTRTLVPMSAPVETLRVVKDEAEIDLLRAACAITDQAFADVLPRVRPGATEREIARALESRMVELGAERPAFDSIVAAGPCGAVPHHAPTDRPIERGDLVTMDFGARVAGYHADMTRTVAVGEPAGWQRDLYDLVAAAQRAGCRALAPGAAVGDVDAAARNVIGEAGHADHFRHGLGHGVGLEIHEVPFLGPARTGRLEDRVPITVEPGVYLPGRGGVRIEDTLVVRDDGPELLTVTGKELLVL
jgi:Xaa-Pro aminopeptidase